MYSAESIARHMLWLASETADEPTPVTQLQLHKIMYYAQGWYLHRTGSPLFSCAIQAWKHGPVVADLHARFKTFGKNPIPPSEARADPRLKPDDAEFVRSIWDSYGRFAGWRLRQMTHDEKPWLNARTGIPDDASSRKEISHADMRAHFRLVHEQNCRRMGLDPAALDRSLADARTGKTTELPLRSREERKHVAR